MVITILFLIVGLAVTADGVFMWFFSNFNLGNIMTLTLGAALIVFGLLHHHLPKPWKLAIIAVFLLTALAMTLLTACGMTDTATYEEDAVIVLGAAIHGERPSGVLRGRLNAAIRYYMQNPDALIVVSGGQGPQENITEALAMERYLLSHGVPAEHILKEEQAASTLENFLFSKALLDDRLGTDYTACFITNEYHIYRAGRYGQQAGLGPLTHIHSNTLWYDLLPGVLRECAAVVKYWAVDCR